MSLAYISAIIKNLPDAKIVFDHFHIKMFSDKLSELRRQLYHVVNEIPKEQVIKRNPVALLKNPENLDNDRGENRPLNEGLKLKESLATAYYMKEDLRQFWKHPDERSAAALLCGWITRAGFSGIRILIDLAKISEATKPVCCLIMILESLRDLLKVPKIRSRPCKNRLMASEIWNSLDSK